jgi:hypothetical protein
VLAIVDRSNTPAAVGVISAVVGHVLGEQSGERKTARAMKVLAADRAVGELVDRRVSAITRQNVAAAGSTYLHRRSSDVEPHPHRRFTDAREKETDHPQP